VESIVSVDAEWGEALDEDRANLVARAQEWLEEAKRTITKSHMEWVGHIQRRARYRAKAGREEFLARELAFLEARTKEAIDKATADYQWMLTPVPVLPAQDDTPETREPAVYTWMKTGLRLRLEMVEAQGRTVDVTVCADFALQAHILDCLYKLQRERAALGQVQS
jgi:hypothetical protein